MTTPRARPVVPLVLLVGCAVADAAGIAAAVHTRRWGFLAIHVVGTVAIAALLVLVRRRTGRW